MSEKTQIKLKKSSILKVPIEKYDNDFTFIVNGQEFKTSRLQAELLSTKICQNHLIDPTLNKIIINTKVSGDFSKILKLINFEEKSFSTEEIPFISEIFQILDIDSIKIINSTEEKERDINTIFELINKHENYEIFYSDPLKEDIDFISSHFYELNDEKIKNFCKLKTSTIEKIIGHSKLRLNTEDQLLNIINQLYKTDSANSFLYCFVDFLNVSVETISEFLRIFDINDITNETWESISTRLLQDIIKNEKTCDKRKCYFNKEQQKPKSTKSTKNKEIQFDNNNSLNGILNFLKKQSNNNIEDAIKITASSVGYGPLTNLLQYEDPTKYFYSIDEPNSWICIDFINRRIIPTHYTIRTRQGASDHPKSWVIEGSNDNYTWEQIDSQTNCNETNGKGVVRTFIIQKELKNEFRYLRMKETGPNWCNHNFLEFSAIEFHGTLIDN